MPDYPPAALAAAETAIRHELKSSREVEPDRLARAALDAAAPVLAEAVAQKILKHSDKHEPPPGSPSYLAWHRHFGTAARVAAGAFGTREDQLRMAAEAIERGDFIACDIPEVPGAR